MKTAIIITVAALMGGCGVQWQTKEDAPVGNYKTVHHTITFDTQPQCVGSCNPTVKSW